MTRWILPLSAVLVAAAGLVWLLVGSTKDAEEGTTLAGLDREGAGAEGGALRENPVELAGTDTAREAAERRARGPRWPVVSTDRIPRGVLEVLPLGPDEKPLPASGITIRLEREGADFWATPLGEPDPETGVWTFRDLPIGRLAVSVVGDLVVESTARAEVLEGQTVRVEVFADRAGMIRYEARLYSGEAPSRIKLRLFRLKGENRLPVDGWFQTRLPERASGAVRGTEVSVGAEGVVFGLAPGRYVLQAESEAGETDEVTAEVRPTETAPVEIRLRY